MRVLFLLMTVFLLNAVAVPVLTAQEEFPQKLSQEEWAGAKKEIDLSTGLKMKYVEMGQREGETLILLHGMTDNSRSWSLIADQFTGKYRVIMPDQRGHGDSGKPDQRMYLPSDYAYDLAALMDAKGLEKANFIGHSLGSMILQTFAVNYPEKVGKIVLVASAPVTFDSLGRELYDAAVAFGQNQPDDEFMASWYANPNPVDENFLKREMAESKKIPPHAWRAITKGSAAFNLVPFIDELKAPTLILWGDQDGFFDRQAQEALKKSIPQAQFIAYEKHGHNLQWEIPGKMAADIIKFFESN